MVPRLLPFSVGEFNYKIHTRDCIPDSILNQKAEGCHDVITGPAMDLINGALGFLVFAGIHVDGKSCYCKSDLCDPNSCNCNGLYLFETW